MPPETPDDVPDIFLSYAREDEEKARRMVAVLQERGYSVWWDPDLVAGPNYVRQIDRVVRQARCVVVLWSHDSINSDFVLEEASIAREQGKLVPVLLDQVELPVSFRLGQGVELLGWRGDANHPGIAKLDLALRQCHSKPPAPVPPPPRRWMAWLLLVAPAVAALSIIMGAVIWPAATVIDADVLTSRLRVRTTATPQQLFDDMPVHSFAVRGFGELRLPKPERGEPLVLHPSGPDSARVSISDSQLSIAGCRARWSEVTLDVPEPGSLGITLRGPQVSGGVSLPDEVRLTATAVSPSDKPSAVLTWRPDSSDRLLGFSSGDQPMRLVLGLAPDRPQALKGDLAVDRIEFQDQASTGEVRSTIQKGSIRFPNRWRGADLNENDFLVVEDLRDFRIRRVELSGSALRVQLYGTGRASYGPAGYLNHTPVNLMLIGVVVLAWALLSWIAWRRFGRAIR